MSSGHRGATELCLHLLKCNLNKPNGHKNVHLTDLTQDLTSDLTDLTSDLTQNVRSDVRSDAIRQI